MAVHRWLIFIFFLVYGISCYGASTDQQAFIEKKEWTGYSKNYDFTENIKKRKKETNKPAKKTVSTLPSFSNTAWLKYPILITVIVILLILLMLLLMSIYKGVNEKVVTKNMTVNALDFDNIEQIEDADLYNILQDAIALGLFRDAVRIRYLILIRKLVKFNLVTWKKDKTNAAYVNEMYGKEGFELFRQITVMFERTWYGGKEIWKQDYQAIVLLFEEVSSIVAPPNQ